ncbi:hypothetical protein PQI23_09830 [Leucobacter sp. USCH14]|uniref:hypothetical protein n=1 Tax=Leucobacter sp. USCH14 TaxID=3024838 RepID=UPI0030AF1879
MRRSLIVGAMLCGIGSVLLIGSTSAAFTQSFTAGGTLAGAVVVAQGTDPADRYGDPEQPNVVAEVTPESRGIATLYDDQRPYPTRPSASFDVRAALLEGSAPADLRAVLSTTDASSADIAPHLRFGIEVDGENQDPGGIPRSIEQINDAGGIRIGARQAGDAAAQIGITVWLATDTPREAYSRDVPVDVTIIAETTPGSTFEVEVTLQ